ncbi:MAG: hypothetical protein QXH91_03550 [Candidatus Bathyarchaeia archaeon]
MLISLSILDYEPDLEKHVNNLEKSEAFLKIIKLIKTGKIHKVHIDVMRPPMIPDQTKFSIDLVKRLYEKLHKETILAIHLMVHNPLPIIEKINTFIPKNQRAKTFVIIQRESYTSEEESIKALQLLKKYGYKAGICLNLTTPSEALTDKIVENADRVLFMSVPMGHGGQKYSDEATNRISAVARKFPNKPIEVDGGIDPKTIVIARRAGAKIAVVGSFITRNDDPERAVEELEQNL